MHDFVDFMVDDRLTETPHEAGPLPFLFVWRDEPSCSLEGNISTLLVWPLAEKRPEGAFARFLLIDDGRSQIGDGRSQIIVPMDIEWPTFRNLPHGQVAAASHADLGSLPLLLRIPFANHFRLTVKYLVRRKLDGVARVDEVTMPPVEFQQAIQPNRHTLVGFVRGKGTDGPSRPIVATGIQYPVDDSQGASKGASSHVEMVDRLLQAYEDENSEPRQAIDSAFVLAIPQIDNGVIGPAMPILPYDGARLPTSMQIISRTSDDPAAADSDPSFYPRFVVRIGTSSANQDRLKSGVYFFHWNRTMGFLQSERNPASSLPRAVEVHRGKMRGADLAFDFSMAGFGDIVGVMVGPSQRVTPSFPEWAKSEAQFFRHEVGDWTIVPFLWTSDELMPLNYYYHHELDQLRIAANRDLVAVASALPASTSDNGNDLARYLLPKSRTAAAMRDLMRAAIDDNKENTVIALDPYCELLRELDQQTRADAREWERLAGLFSFALFEQMPELHRALVVIANIRRDVVPDFQLGEITQEANLLSVMMMAIGRYKAGDQHTSSWLGTLSLTQFMAAWEMLKHEPDRFEIFVRDDFKPDFATLSDWLEDRIARASRVR